MATETIDHIALVKLGEAGVVRSAHVIGHDRGWSVIVKFGMTERVLAAQRGSQVRVVRKLETLVVYLKGVGIPRFEVDAVNYDLGSITTTPQADSAAINDVHAQEAYTTWLKAEIQEAIDDPSPTVPHDEAMRQVRAALKLG